MRRLAWLGSAIAMLATGCFVPTPIGMIDLTPVLVRGATPSGCFPCQSLGDTRADQAAEAKRAEAERQRENAEIRQTGAQLERERAATRASDDDAIEIEGLPDHLDRAAIVDAMRAIAPQVAACRAKAAPSGAVVVAMKIAPDGRVATTHVDSAPDRALGACVAAVAAAATFAPTRSGGSLRYPF